MSLVGWEEAAAARPGLSWPMVALSLWLGVVGRGHRAEPLLPGPPLGSCPVRLSCEQLEAMAPSPSGPPTVLPGTFLPGREVMALLLSRPLKCPSHTVNMSLQLHPLGVYMSSVPGRRSEVGGPWAPLPL